MAQGSRLNSGFYRNDLQRPMAGVDGPSQMAGEGVLCRCGNQSCVLQCKHRKFGSDGLAVSLNLQEHLG